MKIKEKTGYYLLGFLLAVLALSCFLFLVLRLQQQSSEKEQVLLLSKGWDITIGEEEYTNVDLTQFTMTPLGVGEKIILTYQLPSETPKQAVVSILVHHGLVKAFVDGEEVYSYGQGLNLKRQLAGSGYHRIYLGENSSEKLLSIEITSTKKDAFSSFSPVYMGTEAALLQKFILDRQFVIFANVFLVMIGIIFLLISLTIIFINKSLKLLYIGLFSIDIGIWASCNFQLFSILFQNKSLNVTIEYLALYIAPFFTGLLFLESFQKHKRERLIFSWITFVNGLFFLITTLSHFAGFVQLPVFLLVCHGLILVDFVVLIYTVIHNFKKRIRSEKIFLYGLLLFVFVAFSDVVIYNLSKYNNSFRESAFKSFSPWGAVVFVILLLISYLFEIYDKNSEVKEKEFYEKLAYTDYMTQTANRAQSALLLQELDSKKSPYSLISLDLDDLKNANDKYGHQAGDSMIVKLATLLKKVFSENALVCRMGGDEFLVILMNGQELHTVELLEQFQQNLQEENKKSDTLHIHVSYGYALSSEVSGQKADQIYRRADERMYHMKEVYHKIHDRRRKGIDKEEVLTVQSENSK